MTFALLSNLRALFLAVLALFLVCAPSVTLAQQRRDREPSEVYAARRARIAAQTDSPVILWGFTGREEISEAYIFAQEDNFYYLTGHNEEGAGLIGLPGTICPGGAPRVIAPSRVAASVPADVTKVQSPALPPCQ